MKVFIPNVPKSSVLYREIETLRKNLPEILAHPGEWVLIQGETVADFFKSYAAALEAGYKRFGLETFMVKGVDELTGPPLRFSRDMHLAVLA